MSGPVAAVIVAAGRGRRAGTSQVPKQCASIGGEPMLAHAVRAFAAHARIGPVAVVIHPDDAAVFAPIAATFAGRLLEPVPGGPTRQASVLNGLEALAALPTPPAHVLIHDAARPYVSRTVIDAVVGALAAHEGAVPAVELADTLKRAGPGGIIAETIPRAGLFRAQTPQGFDFRAILEAHRAACEAELAEFTDDAALAEWRGMTVALVAGEEGNRKLTTQEDLIMAAASPAEAATGSHTEFRTGQGFDVHRFRAGDHVWLCGVRVPHAQALEGHSDADVALHALTDALLGAMADGDIGQHFPPSDERWRGASSHLFLADARRRVVEAGGRIVNVDVTILCEAPRIGPHRDAMRARVAEILGIAADRIGVKATTTEKLGFTGRREGIAAMAVATIELPRR
jgi:2-C-methyl-D-erythritol 4-phosphate cytidylyltransferase/2-C-methyl-D-erythritol 2,4-cyclodiphosphate synthase